eukprot:TRINITY_DN16108_c0_g1_i1.p1 TRINITY_DN16108_c0_g1~~TRINITY_DN16108_c0_g1_i1.p1  ORF type:complete len:637 (+),score=15.34 TRINITY_DN16108_c0_g1_i1:43-1953(+)
MVAAVESSKIHEVPCAVPPTMTCDLVDPGRLSNAEQAHVGRPSESGSVIMRRSSRFSQQSTIIQALPTHIDADLLRAVSVKEALSGFGKHWSSNAGKAEDYDLSQRRDKVDDFLSHDWSTSRFWKLLGLCHLYNRNVAMCASCTVAIPLAFFGAGPVAAPFRGNFAKFFCPIVLWAVFLTGHLCRPRYVFLDKLCIHQEDVEMKTAGILGLAGFLRASNRLVILWSPRYFSRLWCTYEVVTWCYLKGLDSSGVFFLPVSASLLHILTWMAFSCIGCMRAIWEHLQSVGVVEPSSHYVITLIAGALCLPIFYQTSAVVRQLAAIDSQVRGFRIHDAKCFCCTHDHIDPSSGRRMSCDRKLVYKTLHDWHLQMQERHTSSLLEVAQGSSDPVVGEALHGFDEVVRHELTRTLFGSKSKNMLIFTYLDFVSCCVSIGWGALDQTLLEGRKGRYLFAIRLAVEYSTAALFIFPISAVVLIDVIRRTERMARRLQLTWLLWRLLFATTGAFSYSLCFVCLWLPGQFLISPEEWPWIGDILMLLRWFLLAWLTRLVMRSRHQDSKEPPVHDGAEEMCWRAPCSTDAKAAPRAAPALHCRPACSVSDQVVTQCPHTAVIGCQGSDVGDQSTKTSDSFISDASI